MIEIPLTNGLVTIVDDCDAHLAQFRWRAKRRGKTFYVYRGTHDGGRKPSIIMHRVILGLTDPRIQADHINGDGLDNRRANLRACSHGENQRNRGVSKRNRSGFKGVNWDPRHHTWRAQIGTGRRGGYRFIGHFPTAEAAARAYDDEARKVYGAFAAVNFPRDGERSARASVPPGARSPEEPTP